MDADWSIKVMAMIIKANNGCLNHVMMHVVNNRPVWDLFLRWVGKSSLSK